MKTEETRSKGLWRRRLIKFSSIKLGRIIICRSALERDYAYLIEHDRLVTFYNKEELKIRYYFEDRYRIYTPDFTVKKPGTRLIVEVKPKAKIKKEKYQNLFRIASQICRREGSLFIVVDEEMIRVQPKLRNIRLLYRYAKIKLSRDLQFHCREFFQNRYESSIAEVASFLAYKQVDSALATTYGLTYWGFLETDLMQPINPESTVWFPGKSRG